jgi:hypothetical protein
VTWIRLHLALVVSSIAFAVAVCAIVTLYATAASRRNAAAEPSSVPTIDLSAPAPDYELTPALDTTTPLENTAAVRTIRETYAASAWANLTNNNNFAQYRLYVAQWNSPVAGAGAPGERIPSYPVPIGPVQFTPVAVIENSDGSATVSICTKDEERYFVPATKSVESTGTGIQVQATFSVSPLTETERAELAAYDPPANFLRMRDTNATVPRVDCSTVPVVTQTFTHWREAFVE